MSDEPPEWAQKLLDASDKQSRDLEAHGEAIDEYGENLEVLSVSLTNLQGDTKDNFTRMGTEFGHLKDRAAEDREAAERRAQVVSDRADKKEIEMEDKVGKVHARVDDVSTKVDNLAGEQKNHMEDEHATVAMQTRTDLDTHAADNNRHEGEAPGGGHVKTGATIAGGVGVGGGVIWGIIELARAFAGGS